MDVSQLLKWDTTDDSKKAPERSSSQLADKLIERLVAMALPTTMSPDSTDLLTDRVEASSERPPLSIQVMSKNFIQLNSRLSGPFALVNNIIFFLQWKNPFLTVTILLIYTNLVLHPIPLILTFLPILILGLMTGTFIACYKPDVYNSISNELATVRVQNVQPIIPASELSKEFILNLTDLQNHMLLYVDSWNFLVDILNRFTLWKNETISSLIFLSLLIGTLLTLTFSETLIVLCQPFIKIFLVLAGWGMILSIHPRFYDTINDFIYSESTRLYILKKTNRLEDLLVQEFDPQEDEEPAEVQIFEVWRYIESEWNFIGFRNSAFWPNDPIRIKHELDGNTKLRPKPQSQVIEQLEDGESSLMENDTHEDIQDLLDVPISTSAKLINFSLSEISPPKSWAFKTKSRWKIDLFPEVWIQEDLLSEDSDLVEVDHETKWVYDKGESSLKYRRRRWYREVTRSTYIDDNKSRELDEETQVSTDKEASSGSSPKPKTKNLKLTGKSAAKDKNEST